MCVAPYFNLTFGGIASVRFFRGRYSWMCVCVSLHISIGLLVFRGPLFASRPLFPYVIAAAVCVRMVYGGGGVASVVVVCQSLQ